jgi:hypothetical protein
MFLPWTISRAEIPQTAPTYARHLNGAMIFQHGMISRGLADCSHTGPDVTHDNMVWGHEFHTRGRTFPLDNMSWGLTCPTCGMVMATDVSQLGP